MISISMNFSSNEMDASVDEKGIEYRWLILNVEKLVKGGGVVNRMGRGGIRF